VFSELCWQRSGIGSKMPFTCAKPQRTWRTILHAKLAGNKLACKFPTAESALKVRR
jgi:hypothetical protein